VDGTWTGVRGFGLSEEAGEGMVRVAVQNNYQGPMLVVVMGIGTWLQWQLSLRRQSTVPTSGLSGRQMQRGRRGQMVEGREEDDLVIRKGGFQISTADGLEVEIAR
jgi:hypothetical protein